MPLRRVADQVRGWRKHSPTKTESVVIQRSQAPRSKKKAPPPPPSPEHLLNGIGSYSFLAPLGDGKFSKVYLAKHYLTEEQVAIKVIDKRVHDYRVMSRLVREIKLMEALGDHPNIVRIYETYETADSLFLVMEYVPGKNLDEYLQQKGGSLSEDDARDIFRQVVAAITYCHKRWVVHRDLKAPNVLLTPDKRVKLADFGLGNRYGLKRLMTVCGSMLYYSPEIISHNKYHGPEVDCWCLGISLFRMTAGVEPFSKAGTVGELKEAVVNGAYDIPSHLSDDLKRTIQKCLNTKWRCRRSVQRALRGDIWLNDHGRLPDLFLDDIDLDEATDSTIDDNHRERIERECARRACQKALDDEKRNGKQVSKTVVYHPYHPSIYFTSEAEYSRSKEHRDSYVEKIDNVRTEMYKDIRHLLQQANLQPVQHLALSDVKSPMHHLFRRITGKRALTEASSKSPRNITQFYQRIAKDQIHYYSIRNNVSVLSSTTAVSGYSSLMSTSTIDRAPPSLGYASIDTQHQVDEDDLINVARSVCKILGMTYRQDSRSQLTCILTLRNVPDAKRRQSSHGETTSLPYDTTAPAAMMQGAKRAKGSSCSSMMRSSSSSLMDSTNSQRSSTWWSRQLKRLSVPVYSNQSLHHPSWQPEEEEKQGAMATAGLEGRAESETDMYGSNDGTVMFTIQAFSVPMAKGKNNDSRVVGVWYSKTKGSSKVFKLATGWIAHSLEANYRVVRH